MSECLLINAHHYSDYENEWKSMAGFMLAAVSKQELSINETN